ncbi:putative secreted antigen [Melissococcus plutonius]|nr:putative secreted antigen [Melissococcus plutonius]KMT29226.1 putative secreted antigen [Melissococcus plutonius]KMT35405.1 putative secreted antigen [Melissococcus plutonius]KMT37474.1 putative secreted antigen [Melissococcus plutonius]KMT37648.1 putative secreted antigen [Melissococcus plutonius]
MKKSALSALMVCSIALTAVSIHKAASAETIDSKIQQQNQKIDSLKMQQTQAEKELASIASDMSATTQQAKELTAKKDGLTKEIKDLYDQISDLNVRIQKREVQMQKQARDVQVNGGKSYLDVVLNSESVSDAVTRIQGLSTLMSANNDLLKQQNADKKVVEEKTKTVQKQISDLDSATKELNAKKASLDTLKIQQEVAKNELEAQRTTEENKKSSFIAQKEAAQKKLEEEQARQKAAEEKAQQTAIAEAKQREVAAKQNEQKRTTNLNATDKKIVQESASVETSKNTEKNKPAENNQASGTSVEQPKETPKQPDAGQQPEQPKETPKQPDAGQQPEQPKETPKQPEVEQVQPEQPKETPKPVQPEQPVQHPVAHTPTHNNSGNGSAATGGVSSAKRAAVNAALADVGNSYQTGWNQPGECLVSVRRWLTAGGINFGFGGVHSGYTGSGATEVSWSNVQPGDVVQYENTYSPDGWIGGVHTLLVVAVNGGSVQIVEANNPGGSGYVSTTYGWNPAPPAGFRAVVWRFPG